MVVRVLSTGFYDSKKAIKGLDIDTAESGGSYYGLDRVIQTVLKHPSQIRGLFRVNRPCTVASSYRALVAQ
jgi:hypothetical protein